jgi:hypothetical protein
MSRIGNLVLGIVFGVAAGVIALVELISFGCETGAHRSGRAYQRLLLFGADPNDRLTTHRAGAHTSDPELLRRRMGGVALPAISRDMAVVRDGAESQPTHPSRNTIAAGACGCRKLVRAC